jgi:hypothetical protein
VIKPNYEHNLSSEIIPIINKNITTARFLEKSENLGNKIKNNPVNALHDGPLTLSNINFLNIY